MPRGAPTWLADGHVPAETFVSVNVSAREIQSLGFVDGVKAVLAESGLDPTRLVLEITETALLKANPTTVATLEAVRALGVRTVIDDFGTGYFSLSHLRQFPVDALKIAKEFVQETDAGSKSSALAGAIVAMSRSLGIETVAEGIETPSRPSGCARSAARYGQGYAFARPMLEADLLASFGADHHHHRGGCDTAAAAATPSPSAPSRTRKSPVRARRADRSRRG